MRRVIPELQAIAEAVEIGRKLDVDVLRARQRVAAGGDHGEGDLRFRVLLLGVMDKAGVEDVRVVAQGVRGLAQEEAGLVDEALGFVELTAVDGADRVGGVTKGLAAAAEGRLAGAVLGGERLSGALGDGLDLRDDAAHA